MIGRMAPDIIELKRKQERNSASKLGLTAEEYFHAEILPEQGLSHHMRQLRKRNQGFARWFGLAVILGAVMAIAFVGLLAR
jgi:hypothetical protein